MRSWRKVLVVFMIAGGMLAFVYNRPVPEAEFVEPTLETVAEIGADGETLAEPDPENPTAIRGTSRRDSEEVTILNTRVAESSSPYPLSEDLSLPRWMEDYGERVRRSTKEEFELKRDEANDLDAEAAYWLHEFYKFCDRQPRSGWQLENVLSRVERRIEHEARDYVKEHRLNRAQETLDQYEQGYELCSFLGPDFDAKLASLTWLETAANLGHMGALRLYHSQARQLLTEDDSTLGFQQPDLIHLFKSNAKTYARQLLETGHPQGYLLMARMYYVGDVYEQDFKLAYSYAHAGYLAGIGGSQYDAQMWKRLISQNFPVTEIPEAEKTARELLNQD